MALPQTLRLADFFCPFPDAVLDIAIEVLMP